MRTLRLNISPRTRIVYALCGLWNLPMIEACRMTGTFLVTHLSFPLHCRCNESNESRFNIGGDGPRLRLGNFLSLAGHGRDPAVLRNMPIGRLLVWIFNVEGTVDLIAVIALAAIHDASAYMGRPTGYLRCGSRRC
jgi:hypothetical protein